MSQMQSRIAQGAASAAPFIPAEWLAAWSDNGGIVVLTGDRLFVSRLPQVDNEAGRILNSLRAAVWPKAHAEALADYLLRRSHGETL
ncbi:hypothetical protein GGQ80_003224 [Sphingomonas jinjuensis]|uniref:Uncharacterized protein n=1 Tax=Sphingomonas jinjuensis TaxID=535907 RepID=A0A840FHX1_9SPHN|nr:hypothetical protein [Sphingomonas jinjuensis]MBB4155304.1 hypothetical protein [Sphingomonas jinjuensis]